MRPLELAIYWGILAIVAFIGVLIWRRPDQVPAPQRLIFAGLACGAVGGLLNRTLVALSIAFSLLEIVIIAIAFVLMYRAGKR